MLARRLLLGCLLSLSVGLPVAFADGEDAPKPDGPEQGEPEQGEPEQGEPKKEREKDDDELGPRKNRKLDTESPVARALDELLQVDPRYSEDGTVELIYEFGDETQTTDWTMEGLDRAEETNRRGGRGRRARNSENKGKALSLGAGGSPGLLMHRLPMKGDYEVTLRCHVERTSTRSHLVFLLGKAGASWGTQLVQRGGSGFSRAPGSTRPEASQEAWTGGRVVTVTLAVKAGELTTSVNGAKIDGTKRLDQDKLDGRVGIYLTDMHLVVHRVTIRGTVDPAKL